MPSISAAKIAPRGPLCGGVSPTGNREFAIGPEAASASGSSAPVAAGKPVPGCGFSGAALAKRTSPGRGAGFAASSGAIRGAAGVGRSAVDTASAVGSSVCAGNLSESSDSPVFCTAGGCAVAASARSTGIAGCRGWRWKPWPKVAWRATASGAAKVRPAPSTLDAAPGCASVWLACASGELSYSAEKASPTD